jgi:hypothetical protein
MKPTQSNQKIDLAKLEELLIQAEAAIQASQGKDIVLVVGVTNSGKSTFTVYLQGQPLKEIYDDEGYYVGIDVDPDVKATKKSFVSAKIGHKLSVSETLLPGVYESEHGLTLLDTAGFGDTRGLEYDICSYLALQMAIYYAKSIKGIAIVIDYKSIKADRAAGIRKLLPILEQLLLKDSYYSRSVKFIFTKAEDKWGTKLIALNKQQILSTIKRMIKELEEAPDFSNPEKQASYNMLKVIEQNAEHITVYDPLDNGKSGKPIEDFFNKEAVTIEKTAFSLAVDTRNYQEYSSVICSIASSYLKAKKTIGVENDNLIKVAHDLKVLDQKIGDLEAANKIYAMHGVDPTERRKLLEKQLQDIDRDIGMANHQETLLAKKIAYEKSEKYKLEADRSPAKIYEENYSEHQAYGTVKKNIVKDHRFIFDSLDCPITDHKLIMGRYEITEDRPQDYTTIEKTSHRCDFHYWGPSHEYGRATARAFTEKRLLPGTIASIKRIENRLSDLNDQLDTIKQAKKDHHDLRKCTRENLTNIIAGEAIIAQDVIEANRGQINTLQEKRDQLVQECRASLQKRIDAEETLEKSQNKYEMVIRLDRFKRFEEEIVREFIQAYSATYTESAKSAATQAPATEQALSSMSAQAAAGAGTAPSSESVHSIVSNSVLRGLRYTEMPEDDHCFFNGVGIYLGKTSQELRREVAEYLDNHPDEFHEIIASSGRSRAEYIRQIRDTAEWGDHLVEIEVIQRITNRPVIIISSNNNPIIPDNLDNYQNDPIFVYCNGHNHYDGLSLEEGSNPREILANIQKQVQQGQSVFYSLMTQLNQHSPLSSFYISEAAAADKDDPAPILDDDIVVEEYDFVNEDNLEFSDNLDTQEISQQPKRTSRISHNKIWSNGSRSGFWREGERASGGYGLTSHPYTPEGLEFRPVTSTIQGHCFYDAVRLSGSLSASSQELREKVAEYLSTNWDNPDFEQELAQRLQAPKTSTREKLLEAIRENAWAESLEILILSRILQRSIGVISQEGTLILLETQTGEPIFIHHNGSFEEGHFNAYELTGEKAPQDILRNLIQRQADGISERSRSLSH